MVSLVFGIFAVVLGIWGMWVWRVDLIYFVKGMGPLSLFLAGVIAIIAGISSRVAKPSSRDKET
jgi:hypothetical protein